MAKKNEFRKIETKVRDAKKLQMIEAVAQHYGNQTKACKEVKLPRATHYKWMKEDAEYALQIEDAALTLVDAAITIVNEAILNGDKELAWKLLCSPIAQSRGFYIPVGREGSRKSIITDSVIINAD